MVLAALDRGDDSAYDAGLWPRAKRLMMASTRMAGTMWYVILARDNPGSLEHRLAARGAHLERLDALRDEGRLLLAGPLPAIDAQDPGPAGFAGSLIVANFASLEIARAWADADPYVAAGVYRDVEIHPFRKVLP